MSSLSLAAEPGFIIVQGRPPSVLSVYLEQRGNCTSWQTSLQANDHLRLCPPCLYECLWCCRRSLCIRPSTQWFSAGGDNSSISTKKFHAACSEGQQSRTSRPSQARPVGLTLGRYSAPSPQHLSPDGRLSILISPTPRRDEMVRCPR